LRRHHLAQRGKGKGIVLFFAVGRLVLFEHLGVVGKQADNVQNVGNDGALDALV
jgi:hypothetical protein